MKYYLFKSNKHTRVNFVENDIIVKRIAFDNKDHTREYDKESCHIGKHINEYIKNVGYNDKRRSFIWEITEAEAFEICL